jgi:hypothetical protein
MTLKKRNRLFFVFFLISLAFSLVYLGMYIYASVAGKIIPINNFIRPISLFVNNKLFSYSFAASIIGISIFIIYVPIVMFVLFSGFEKTQSIEIIYFSGFVLACLAESLRITLPLSGLWQTYSSLFLLAGRVVYTGRILASISFLFAAIFNGSEQRQNVERNYLILLVVSLMLGIILPLDTSRILSTCIMHCGFNGLFNVIRFILFLTTLATIVINAVTKDSSELKENAVGYVALMIGYELLQKTDNYMTLIIATLFFAIGNVLYLRSIHTMYMWQ